MRWRLGLSSLLWGLVPLFASASLAGPGPCPSIDTTLTTGSRWAMCWQWKPAEGVVFTDVYFTTPGQLERKVLAEASLAQVHAGFDDGSATHQHVSNQGLGTSVRGPGADGCPGGILHAGVVCERVEPRGYAYKHYDSKKQGYALSLSSISSIGDRTYIVQWRFFDDGTIEPSVGLAGRLERYGTDPRYGWPVDSEGTIAVASVYNYVWRLHFDIAGNGANDVVEELAFPPDASGSRRLTSVTALSTEAARSTDPENMRSWRVRDGSVSNADGHSVSYHLEPLEFRSRYIGPASQPWSQSELHVTAHRACERLASGNPTAGGCADNVAGFVNGENIHTADVVVWYRVAGHHLPRDEDEPNLRVRWDGFALVPRDWTAQSPL